MRIRLVFALAALAVAAGCGTAEREDQPTPSITGAQIKRAFEAETGRRLRNAAVQDPAWEQLSFGLDPPPDIRRRYGVFTIYVVDPGNEKPVASLLANKVTGKPLAADERGIYWEYDSHSKTWIANRRYGENVVLVWFTERRERVTDARFARLDDVLTELSLG